MIKSEYKPENITLDAINKFHLLIVERWNIFNITLFGSRSDGTHKPDSDTDVAIIINSRGLNVSKTVSEMADIAYSVFLDTGVLISPMPIEIKYWNNPSNYSNPNLILNIKKGYTVYEK